MIFIAFFHTQKSQNSILIRCQLTTRQLQCKRPWWWLSLVCTDLFTSGEAWIQMSLSPRLSNGSASLSICGEESFRPSAEANDADNAGALIEQESTSSSDSSLASFLSMSRVKQLTVISLSLSNLGAGCFFSLLGPFFPAEVYIMSVISYNRPTLHVYRGFHLILTNYFWGSLLG